MISKELRRAKMLIKQLTGNRQSITRKQLAELIVSDYKNKEPRFDIEVEEFREGVHELINNYKN